MDKLNQDQDDCTESLQSSSCAIVLHSYEKFMQDFIQDEQEYIRDLCIIIKVTYVKYV